MSVMSDIIYHNSFGNSRWHVQVSHPVLIRTECRIKQPPKKTYISLYRERHNLNYSNLQHLLTRDWRDLALTGKTETWLPIFIWNKLQLTRDIAWDSENFIHIFCRKQKLQLSKLKSAILQLNTRYYRDCYSENANKTNCMEFIWKDKCSPKSSDSLLDYHVWTAMVEMYHCRSKADRQLRNYKERCVSDLGWLASRYKLMQQ